MYKIYGKPNCAYCTRAKILLENNNLEYEYIEIGKHISRDNFIYQFPHIKTVPLIFLDHAELGGYEQLRDYLEKTY